MDRVVLHVDMDAFFASCEAQRRPDLAGRPLIVGADPREGTGRGVVVSADYTARAAGVRSAMPIQEAWRRCPEAAFVWPDHRHYMDVSRRVFSALAGEFRLRQSGIDEGFIEATGTTDWSGVRAVAESIMACVARVGDGLPCSVGVGPNRLVAKIATDQRKPRGITIVPPHEVQEFLDPLSIRRLPGVGPKTAKRLEAEGIRTVRELRLAPGHLVSSWGRHGPFLQRAAHGQGDGFYQESAHRTRSMSEERTFPEDVRDRSVVLASLRRMVGSLEEDLGRRGYWFRHVALKVRYSDFETHTRQASLSRPSSDTTLARRVLPGFLDSFLKDARPIRLIGVRFGDLVRANGRRTLADFL